MILKGKRVVLKSFGEEHLKDPGRKLSLAGKVPEIFLPLTWKQIKEMSKNNISFGAHTHTHPYMSLTKDRVLDKEISECKKIIKKNLGVCTCFAYPFGGAQSFNEKSISKLKKNKFSMAMSMIPGNNNKNTDLFSLRRIGITGQLNNVREFAAHIHVSPYFDRAVGVVVKMLK